MPTLAIRLSPPTTSWVARADILPGIALPGEGVAARAHVPAGHKVGDIGDRPRARRCASTNQIIGFATSDIAAGDHVHTHNVAMGDFARDYAFAADYKPTDYVPQGQRATFEGIVRPNGKVATRNYLGILSSVNCSATAAALHRRAVPHRRARRLPPMSTASSP